MDLDDKISSIPKRQPRFTPKAPPLRKLKKINPTSREALDKDDDEAGKALLQRVNENLGKRGSKFEKKSSVQVAFANNIRSSSRIRSFGVPKQGNGNITTNSSGSNSRPSTDNGKILACSPSTAIQDGASNLVIVDESSCTKKKVYKEHWDYSQSNYPITLPLRPPYSGDPELLDEMEFGKTAMDLEYNESTVNPASELGFLEDNDEPQMLFLQLPTTLPLETPLEKQLATTGQKDKDKDKVGASKSPLQANEKGKEKVGELKSPKMDLNKHRSVENMPKGHMGKLLVYKSGKIKWKIGDVVYNVSPGVSCNFAQDVVAINTAEKHVCTLGEVGKRAVVSLDIDSLLNSNLDLDSP